MSKHDGWTIKNTCGRRPWLVTDFFHAKRQRVIEDFEFLWGKGCWRKERRAGNFRLVKIKLIEVV